MLRISGLNAINLSKLIGFRKKIIDDYINKRKKHIKTKFEETPSWLIDRKKLRRVEYERRHRIQRDIRVYNNIRRDLVKDVIKSEFEPFFNNIVIDKVVEINQEKYEKTWIDFEVKDTHTFLHGSSVFTHNCTAVDPFQAVESRYRYSEKLIELFTGLNLPIEFITKKGSNVPDRVYEMIAGQEHSFVQYTILTPLDDVLKRIAVNADPLYEQLKAIESASSHGIKNIVARFDPIIPTITDSEDDLETLFGVVKDAGATHSIMSSMDIPGRIQKMLFDHFGKMGNLAEFKRIYKNDQNVGKDLNASMEYRRNLFSTARKIADKTGITFSLCMEFEVIKGENGEVRYRGLNEDYMSSTACEGINTPIYFRDDLSKKFNPISSAIKCDGNCLSHAKNGEESFCKGACECQPFKEARSLKKKDYDTMWKVRKDSKQRKLM
jgi:DNA repair photolyase